MSANLINKIKSKQLLKIISFGLVFTMLIIILLNDKKVKTTKEQDLLINLAKEPRTNYPKTETVWATLEIPSLKIDVDVFRGENNSFLNYGVLHHKESYFPTENRTILIAGNNTYLKSLSKIKTNEKIYLKTIYGKYKYIVEKTEIKNVDKLSKELEIKNEEELVIYTPYPETEGYKSDRFVVFAKPEGDSK